MDFRTYFNPDPSTRHACSGIVTVIVGPEGKPFFFHQSLLCEKSPWFRAQLHNQMAEGVDSNVELSPIETSFCDFQQSQRKVIYRYEDDVHTFNQFFTWIYGYIYAIPRRDPEIYDPTTHVSEWILLHTLSMELGVMDLAHRALWEYVHCRDTLRTGYWVPLRSEIQFIYCHRVSTNDLRNLIVEKVRSLLFSTRCKLNRFILPSFLIRNPVPQSHLSFLKSFLLWPTTDSPIPQSIAQTTSYPPSASPTPPSALTSSKKSANTPTKQTIATTTTVPCTHSTT